MRSVWSLAWLLALPSFVLGCNAILGFDQDYKTGSGASGGGSGGTTSTGGMSTGGMSTGGMHTGGSSTGGTLGCKAPEDCPMPPSACSQRACDAGVCSVTLADKDTPASSGQNLGDCSTIMCDGNGGIYLGADPADVPAAVDECHVGSCDGGPPHQVAAPIGTACAAGGGIVCDGNGLCVECLQSSDCPMGACAGYTCVSASCGDGIKDVNETDTDCGGACGASCAVGQICMTGADCITGNCESAACALLPVGAACDSDAVCASGACASGVCCGTACLGACNTCATGACEPVPAGEDPQGACAPSVCDGAGSCGLCEPGIEIGECCTNCAKDPGPSSAMPGDTDWTPPCCVPQVCGANGQPEPCF